jgi:hypothetical protein
MEVSARGPSRLLRVKAATASSLGAPPWWSDVLWRLCGRLAWEPALDILLRALTCLKCCIHWFSALIMENNVSVESKGFWWRCIYTYAKLLKISPGFYLTQRLTTTLRTDPRPPPKLLLLWARSFCWHHLIILLILISILFFRLWLSLPSSLS